MSSKVLSIVGPTGVGKSNLALHLARQCRDRGIAVEIISMDSALVYKGMDIGTAKPTRLERDEFPHHLIDIIDPRENYSAAQFASDTKRLIQEIRGRGHTPLIVGGTMLYWRAWAYGFSNLPPADPNVRDLLDQEAATVGWPAMHAKLARVDPESAKRLKVNDSQRIQRALEVYAITGRPLSDLFLETPTQSGRDGTDAMDIEIISLEPADRKSLHARLEGRFDQMLQHGLISEVEGLYQRGDLHINLPSIRAVGYRQVWEYLAGEIDFDTMKQKAYAATRQLSKRQMTWLRAMNRQAIDAFNPKEIEAATQKCLSILGA